ncbi:MAG: hypothetical protein PHD40_10290, partial [Syntrophomonadaceae bacterium]|nr:hypothetical protein [Syntrophomonadaceae bacterium]
ADGTPLFFPVPLKIAVIAMMSEHLILAGPVEGLVTSVGLWFVGKNYPAILMKRISNGARIDGLGVEKHV